MGTYRHGKQTKQMDQQEFIKIMDEGDFKKPALHKAFFAMLYYTGARKAEILDLKKEEFFMNADGIVVKVIAKKRGVERGAYILNEKLPYVSLIKKVVTNAENNARVFPFNSRTAWNIVKRVLPKHYPHYFRLNRCVKFLNNPKFSLDEIRQWFAWKKIDTVNNYLGYSERTTGKLSEALD